MSVKVKMCNKCGELKPLFEFGRDKRLKDGLQSTCRACEARRLSEYRKANREKVSVRQSKWREDNREKVSEYNREYYRANHEKIINRSREYYKANRDERIEYALKREKANPEKVLENRRRWRAANRKNVREYSREYERKRRAEDIRYRLANVLRCRLNKAIRGLVKKGSAVRDLGCSIGELKAHLEALFEEGMTWENYGKWHVDHILPLSSFDLTDREQLLEACHYTNLQPLWAEDNLQKHNKMPGGKN